MEIPAVWFYLHAAISIALAFHISRQSTETYLHAHYYAILHISQFDLNGQILEQVARIEFEWSIRLLYSIAKAKGSLIFPCLTIF